MAFIFQGSHGEDGKPVSILDSCFSLTFMRYKFMKYSKLRHVTWYCSVTALQLQGPWFNYELGLLLMCKFHVGSPSGISGFLPAPKNMSVGGLLTVHGAL